VNLILLPLYLLYRFSSWARYWTLRRFTRAGLAVLGAFLVAGTMGLDTENLVTYQAFTLLLALLLVAFVPTCVFRAKFSVHRLLPRFGTAGHPLVYRVTVRNLTRRKQTGLTLLENLADPRPSFGQWWAFQLDAQRRTRPFRLVRQHRRTHPFRLVAVKESLLPPMAPRQEVEARIELTPLRRGVLRFVGVTLARPDPLGLFRAFIKAPVPQSVLILPKRYFIPPLALPGAMKYQQGGVALAANVGQSEEFVALRDYRRGDPLRHIHWRSWARVGKPIVKEFEDEFFVRHALVLDTYTDRLQSDEFEEAVSVAASFACTVLTQESLLDLLFVGPQAYCFTVGRGLAHVDQMLEILASVQPCPNGSFDTLEHLVLNRVGAVSGCICVLLAWDGRRRKFVEKLRALGLPVSVFVVVPRGAGGRPDAGPMRNDPERLQVLEVGRIEEQLARLA